MWFISNNKKSLHLFAGCYAISEVQNVVNKTFELSISSPPLCQQRCLQENIFFFALQVCKLRYINPHFIAICAGFLVFHVNVFSFEQAERCICLSDSFDNFQNQLASLNCTYTCNESGLLSNECGGESAFNVFRTGEIIK